jgi:coenzyme F420-0:L-glutamate ligase / coenzyme F420-1:gamma-L-glutamate ligase
MAVTPEKLHAFLRSRRSVRRFQPGEISDELMERILASAVYAPSAHNRQPWRFVVVRSLEAKTRLADAMGAEFRRDLHLDGLSEQEVEEQVERSRARIMEAPAGIILFLDLAELDQYPDERRRKAEHIMGVQSVALAGGNLLLAAHAEGLGGVWVCAPLFAPQSVRSSLEVPSSWEPQGILLLGKPARNPESRPRKPLAEVSIYR